MSVMCLSDGSHWPATTAECQKKKKLLQTKYYFLFTANHSNIKSQHYTYIKLSNQNYRY